MLRGQCMLLSLKNHRYVAVDPLTGEPYSAESPGARPDRKDGSVFEWSEASLALTGIGFTLEAPSPHGLAPFNWPPLHPLRAYLQSLLETPFESEFLAGVVASTPLGCWSGEKRSPLGDLLRAMLFRRGASPPGILPIAFNSF